MGRTRNINDDKMKNIIEKSANYDINIDHNSSLDSIAEEYPEELKYMMDNAEECYKNKVRQAYKELIEYLSTHTCPDFTKLELFDIDDFTWEVITLKEDKQ